MTATDLERTAGSPPGLLAAVHTAVHTAASPGHAGAGVSVLGATSRPEVAMRSDHQLYHLSGLVDSVRDGAHALFDAKGQDLTAATRALAVRYNSLRAAVLDHFNLLDDRGDVERITTWTDDLPTDATLAAVFDAALTLARILDLGIQVDTFVANRIQQRLEINQVLAQAAQAYPEAPARSGGAPPATPQASTGQYL